MRQRTEGEATLYHDSREEAPCVWTPTRVTVQHSPSRLFRSSVLTTLLLNNSGRSAEHRVAGPPHPLLIFSPMNLKQHQVRERSTSTRPQCLAYRTRKISAQLRLA